MALEIEKELDISAKTVLRYIEILSDHGILTRAGRYKKRKVFVKQELFDLLANI